MTQTNQPCFMSHFIDAMLIYLTSGKKDYEFWYKPCLKYFLIYVFNSLWLFKGYKMISLYQINELIMHHVWSLHQCVKAVWILFRFRNNILIEIAWNFVRRTCTFDTFKVAEHLLNIYTYMFYGFKNIVNAISYALYKRNKET